MSVLVVDSYSVVVDDVLDGVLEGCSPPSTHGAKICQHVDFFLDSHDRSGRLKSPSSTKDLITGSICHGLLPRFRETDFYGKLSTGEHPSSLVSLTDELPTALQAFNPPSASPTSDSVPIRFGILGAAKIAPNALITPAISHPEAVVSAVAARDGKRAEVFAKKHGIPKSYGGANGYQGEQESQYIFLCIRDTGVLCCQTC